MRPKKLFIVLALISLVLLPVTPALAEEVTASDIAEQLICQCGCELVLSECDCPTREEMVTIIEQKLAQGESQEEILDFFVAQYGAQVLAPPPTATTTQSSNQDPDLVLWVLALIGILAVGVIIYQTKRKRVRGKKR